MFYIVNNYNRNCVENDTSEYSSQFFRIFYALSKMYTFSKLCPLSSDIGIFSMKKWDLKFDVSFINTNSRDMVSYFMDGLYPELWLVHL